MQAFQLRLISFRRKELILQDLFQRNILIILYQALFHFILLKNQILSQVKQQSSRSHRRICSQLFLECREGSSHSLVKVVRSCGTERLAVSKEQCKPITFITLYFHFQTIYLAQVKALLTYGQTNEHITKQLRSNSIAYPWLLNMNQEVLPRKRTRSETVGKDLVADGEPALGKRQIVEEENPAQSQHTQSLTRAQVQSKTKELRRKLKRIDDTKNTEDVEIKAQPQSKTIKAQEEETQKKKKKKHKHNNKEDETQASKNKKQKKKKRKSDKNNKDDQQVKEEQKQESKKTKKKAGEEQKQDHKNKSKKKRKDKSKDKQQKIEVKKAPDSEHKAKQEESKPIQQAQKKDQKNSKKSKKDKKDKKKKKKKQKDGASSSNDSNQSDSQESDNQQQEGANKKKKKIKKEEKRGRGRGRKPIGPVKRKKASIYEQQQIINKKYRVKKKSTYINKMSDRAWGELRAGPYRTVKKFTKAEQRLIIDSLLGDGPKKETSNAENKSEKQNLSVKIEGQNQENTENQEKIEEDDVPVKSKPDTESSDESQKKQKPKKRSKRKAKQDSGTEKTLASTTASRKSKSVAEDSQVKVQAKSKSKKKKKAENESQDNDDEQQAKIQHGQQVTKTKSKSKKKKNKNSDSESSSDDQKQTKGKKKKSAKKDVKQQNSSKKTKVKAAKEEDHEFPKQDSEKIIDLFAVDGGNYPQMMKQLPGIRLKKVRMHLRMLFHRALDIITYQVQHRCGRKIKEWEQDERIEIVRELHRIRSSNRLLSEANDHFRDKMTALMRSYNDESWLDKVSEQDIETLYRKLEAFVRGYNTINRSKRTSAASITESKNKEKEQRYKFSKEVTRKPIICGGHLLSKSVKNEEKQENQQSEYDDRTRSMLPPQKLIEEWNRQEEKTLCELYVGNQEADETICDKLKEKYGAHIKWRDFELLGRKIDQLIKYALIKLQNLTARPYSKLQRQKQLLRKRAKLQLKLKKEHESERLAYYKQKLRTTSMFLYDNEIFQKEERLEYKHRIFKNLSLLERQIFGHIQSYKIKNSLVKILIQEFPTQEDVEEAVREAKKFSKWAREEERKSNITSIKNVFIGEREDRDFRDDNQNEDSIMADIQKIEITRKEGYPAETHQLSEEADEKSVLFVQSVAGRAEQPIQILNDNDEVEVSDFQEPQSVRSHSNDEKRQAKAGENFKMLHKLYETLNTNKPK